MCPRSATIVSAKAAEVNNEALTARLPTGGSYGRPGQETRARSGGPPGRPRGPPAVGCRSGDAACVATAEAPGRRGRDHHIVVAVLVGRPADGPGLAALH